jgi:LysR family nitrogen assimilation transcriptional regulator
METRRLQAFIQMIDAGSLTRAAQLLGIAQPALSQQVAMMEADFGVQLLVRSRKGVTPTPAGRALYRHAQTILRQLDQAHDEVARSIDELTGTVRIGLPLTAAAILSIPLLRAVHARHPNVSLYLVDGMPGNLLNEFTMNGRIDIGLLPGNISAAHVNVRPLLSERLALVCSAQSALGSSREPIQVRDLDGLPLVLPEETNRVRQVVDAGFASVGIEPNVVSEMNSVYSLCSAAAANLGAAIVPMAGAQIANSHLVVRLLVDPEIERPIHLGISDAAPLTAPAQAIYDLILDVTANLIVSGEWPGARLMAAD